jgi:hypothetical protein
MRQTLTTLWNGAAVFWLIGLLGTIVSAYAHDDGRHSKVDPAIKAWIKALTDKNGNGCCDTADGYPAEVEWDTDTGHYRVRIDGAWYDVPDEALIEKPNRLGYAMVWYYPSHEADGRLVPKIMCFLPGAGG